MATQSAWLKPLEMAINRYLALDPETLARMEQLEGRVIAVELKGLPLCGYLFPHAEGVWLLDHFDGEPDARLRGTPLGLLRLGVQTGGTRGLFSGDVEIEGDTELGRQFKQILDRIQVDWEEQLSHWVGDVPAHQLGRAARAARGWARQAGRSVEADLGEYLHYEARLLPDPAEVQRWIAEVDTLRSDVDRLAARTQRLRRWVEDENGQ